MNTEYISVDSEIHELEALLSAIPEDNVIERMSLEARLRTAKETLVTTARHPEPPKVSLTFRGKPVSGSHGIAADFAAKAAGAFADAFAAVAAGLNENLRHAGPIPNRDKNQLLITGTAIGSFGFEFELPEQEPSFFPDETAEKAMSKIKALLRLTAEGSDDDVAEVIEEVHPRAVKKVYEFLELLVQQQAWCGLEFGGGLFRYTDYEQIKNASIRLRHDNIQDSTQNYQGEFQGVLPSSRIFEFKIADEETVVRGKVDSSIDDPGILNREWLHKRVVIRLHVMRVGQGRPRFTLLSLDDISLEERSAS